MESNVNDAISQLKRFGVDSDKHISPEIVDTICLIAEDAKVAFNSQVKRIYRPHKYGRRDCMATYRAQQAKELKNKCFRYLQEYFDGRIEKFDKSVDGLAEHYGRIRKTVYDIFSTEFAGVETLRREEHPDGVRREETFFDILFMLVFLPVAVILMILSLCCWLGYLFRADEFDGYIETMRTQRSWENLWIRNCMRNNAISSLDRVMKLVRS